MAALENGRQNGLYTYDSFKGGNKKSNSNFLWWCSGAHQDLLKNHPSEHVKYAGLGGVLLATFVLAALSSGYAVYSVFDNIGWALAFGVVWGLIIFNFDRYLVSTVRKYGVSMRKQLWMAVPRLLLALLIGITIARPLELKIFEKEVEVKVAENRHSKILLNDSLVTVENKKILESASAERDRLQTRKLSIEDSLHQLQQAYVAEADGSGGSHQRGIENLTRLKMEAYTAALAQYTPELKQLTTSINYQDSILKNTAAGTDIKRKQFEAVLNSRVGFLEKNKALSDLSAQEPSIWWADLLISMLIIFIEIGPVLSKLIMNAGPYDIALAKEELTSMAESENDMKWHKELSMEKLNELAQMKKDLSSELNEKLVNLQRKYFDKEIEQWERGDRTNISRTTIDELMKRIKTQYEINEKNVL